ncbi:MAG: hypothetical protein A2117_02055 [Candidatus Wildermuthbacteria bacterium GWA2_46_15]|uniref:Uncharacterized protein n=1 Tax=Candidatus Wildermuthbacteria bacterium GWA2_46_15 TaxID=1802443 RepID=A0A1G2QQI0_9BACT|nr:MAG: hypothetical protein A2117_02055 [Candidatus Wildermuthbacteria bacterium GWA2_46_15]
MLKQVMETVLDVVLPRSCLGCGREGKYICEQCDLFLSEAPTIFPKGDLEEVVSGWEYDGLIKDIISKIKYDGMFDAINELVEKALAIKEPFWPAGTVVTFVPLFKKRERERGFNQAKLIAKKLGGMTGKDVLPFLEKIKDTRSQTELDKVERLANVKGSFRKKEGAVCPNNVLLVDDVWTSGATMRECAKVLRRAGVKKVFGFTLARTI